MGGAPWAGRTGEVRRYGVHESSTATCQSMPHIPSTGSVSGSRQVPAPDAGEARRAARGARSASRRRIAPTYGRGERQQLLSHFRHFRMPRDVT